MTDTSEMACRKEKQVARRDFAAMVRSASLTVMRLALRSASTSARVLYWYVSDATKALPIHRRTQRT